MKALRKVATPLTVGSFVIMGVTGVLMFFHLDGKLNETVHEWAGWALLAGVLAHLVVNWRAFSTYFKRPLARTIMGAGVLVLALSFLPPSLLGAQGGGSPVDALLQSVGRSDVGTLIALSGQEVDAGLARLAQAGMAAQADTPVQDLTGGDRGQQMAVIRAIFQE